MNHYPAAVLAKCAAALVLLLSLLPLGARAALYEFDISLQNIYVSLNGQPFGAGPIVFRGIGDTANVTLGTAPNLPNAVSTQSLPLEHLFFSTSSISGEYVNPGSLNSRMTVAVTNTLRISEGGVTLVPFTRLVPDNWFGSWWSNPIPFDFSGFGLVGGASDFTQPIALTSGDLFSFLGLAEPSEPMRFSAHPVPEPAIAALLAIALASIGVHMRYVRTRV